MPRVLWFALGSLAVLALIVVTGMAWPGAPDDQVPRIQGITLDSVSDPGMDAFVELRALGVTHVTVIPYGFTPRDQPNELRFNTDARWFTESDRGITTIDTRLDSLGMHLIIKPQLWLGRGGWTGELAFDTEDGWQRWETQYRAWMMHYANLATRLDAAMLVVGTELGAFTQARPDFWRSLIAQVRTVYSGPVTYAGNWYDDYDQVTFWDALDYIGVQAYFPLTTDPDPPTDSLQAAWATHRDALAALSATADLPVLVTELGYRNIAYAAAEPWRWPERGETTDAAAAALQSRLYEAAFSTLWDEPWLAGTIIWKWHGDMGHRRAGRASIGFTPQGKPAEAVLAKWYGQPGEPNARPGE
ncbi:MAG: hypothetical protein AAF730_01365 [Bacteroidota bacterium]